MLYRILPVCLPCLSAASSATPIQPNTHFPKTAQSYNYFPTYANVLQ